MFFDLDRILCASRRRCFENGGTVSEGLQGGWNGVGGVLTLGCEFGDCLPISGRIVQSLSGSLRGVEFLLVGITVDEGGQGFVQLRSVRESPAPRVEEGS